MARKEERRKKKRGEEEEARPRRRRKDPSVQTEAAPDTAVPPSPAPPPPAPWAAAPPPQQQPAEPVAPVQAPQPAPAPVPRLPESQPPQVPGAPQPPPEGVQAPPPEAYAPGYYWPQPWYPYPSAPFGYGQPFMPPPDQTGQMPVVPLPGGLQPPGPEPFSPLFPLPPHPDEPGFEELARPERVHWRIDFKWVFGIATVLFLAAALAFAGLYRVTGSGSSRALLVPLIEKATGVRDAVTDNYGDLRDKARLKKRVTYTIPDVGVNIAVKGELIVEFGPEELADRVVSEIAKLLYSEGYRSALPMRDPQGVGEERAKAASATILASLNKRTHRNLVWPLAVFGGLALVFAILFILFCRGWGKVAGPGMAIIAASLPASLFLRAGGEILWSPGSGGAYKGAMYECFRGASSMMVTYFDAALGLGALVLLVGVIGGAIATRARGRIVPFEELTDSEKPEVAPRETEPPIPTLLPEVPPPTAGEGRPTSKGGVPAGEWPPPGR